MSVQRWICILLLWLPALAAGQVFPLPLPRAMILPNYDSVLVGKDQALEAGAYIARASDASANFYNAAGLVSENRTSLNASSDGYVVSQITSKALDTSFSETSIDGLPGFFGLLIGAPFIKPRNLRVGFAVARVQAWRPPGVDLSALAPVSAPLTEPTFSSRSSFRTLRYQAAGAWAPLADLRLRLGLTFGVEETTLDVRTSLSGNLYAGGGTGPFLCSVRTSGDEWDWVAGVGVQWDVGGGVSLGARVQTPAVKLSSNSLLTYEASLLAPGAPTSYFFRDDAGTFRYRHPLEASLGAAYHFRRVEVELDLRYHDAVGAYDFYRSEVLLQTQVQNPDGSTTRSTSPGPTYVYAAHRVVNLAAGGNLTLTRSITLHAGFYSSFSPVEDPATSPLRRADLFGITAGADFQVERFGASVGLGYQFGTSAPIGVAVDNLTAGEAGLVFRSLSILYAFSYQF